jgi:hypothetical protein
MYELNDSYFVIFDSLFLTIASVVIILAIVGFFFIKAKKRSNQD